MPLDFGTGPTYTQIHAARMALYEEKSPTLLAAVLAALNSLEAETVDGTPFLVTLNNVSMDLARLNPDWHSFSVVCASAFLACGDVGIDMLYRRVKISFEATKGKLGNKPSS